MTTNRTVTPEQVKDKIITFLRDGYVCGDFTNINWDDYIPFLPLLIQLHPVTNQGLYANSNPFWKKSNELNRLNLIDRISLVNSFDDRDSHYKSIMAYYEFANAFGIRKPVARQEKEPFFNLNFEKACAYYFLPPQKRQELKEDGYYKLYICYQNGDSFTDFEAWRKYESILGISINHVEFRLLDAMVYGNPEELDDVYMSPEFLDITDAMRYKLERFRGEYHNLAEAYVSMIKVHWSAGEKDKAYANYFALSDLFEHPEGMSVEEMASLNDDFASYANRLPAALLRDVFQYKKSDFKQQFVGRYYS